MSAAPAGAAEWSKERRSASPLRLSLLLGAVAVLGGLSTACDRHDSAPLVLIDGSEAATPGIELEGISSPAVLTKVRVVRVTNVRAGSLAAECLRGPARDAHPSGPIVERIGVTSETVTLRDASGLHGCDNSPGPREENRRWCGSSSGRLYSGHLWDPRLDIAGCSTANGAPMGFAWVEASRGTRYVVVEQPGYAEVYEVAAGLPLRIATTSGVRIEGSRATFDISEHDQRGRLLRHYRLEAVPAG